MTEPDRLPSTSPASCQEDPTPGAPHPPDAHYGYALPGRRPAQVAVMCLVLAFFAIVAAFLPQARAVAVPLWVSLVPLLAVALAAAVPLAAAGRADAQPVPLLAGWAVVLGGAASDILATVIHSPDLAREANPALRGLLDRGVSLGQVYLFGAVLQALFVGLTMVLWLGLLKHRYTLAATMPPSGSLLAYFKAGTGGRELSYRQWLCPLAYKDLPWAYHVMWWSGVAFVGISAYRFYLALEWYGVAPLDPLWVRFITPSVVLLATCWWYAAWLRETRSRLGHENLEAITTG
jgi:hypothetical protein